MQKYNTINGFHLGEPANATGIGKWLTLMANNNIPFSVKATNGTSGLIDGQNLIKAGHDGFLVWRKMYGFSGSSDDVPLYGSPIEAEADRYWNAVLRDFPKDLDKNLVFVELINEPNKEYSSWLGYLGKAIGERAVRDGYRVLLFGWSTGEPEYEHWETEGMLAFLRYCAEHPNQVGLSLHEYSLTTANLTNEYPYLLGRFWMVHEVCDLYEIPRPLIYISEFGYEYNDFPTDMNQLATDLIVAGQIYAEHENIKGAAIWALDKVGWGGIDKKVHKLMWNSDQTYSPLFDIIINNPYQIEEPPVEPDETFGEFLERVAEENRVINYNSLAALELQMVNDGFVPYGNEKWETYSDGSKWAIQGARRLGIEPPERRVYYASTGNFNSIFWVPQGNEPTEPEPELEIFDVVNQLPKHATKTYATRSTSDITTLAIHHTVGISTPQGIASYHVNSNDWPGIGYHYVIEQDGKISQTNYPKTISYQAGVVGEQNNEFSMGIAMVGNFTSSPPTQPQIESCRKLVEQIQDQFPRIKYVLPHRFMPGQTTACPGDTWEFWFNQITNPVPVTKPVSIKFVQGDVIAVTSTTLNIRQSPGGTIISAAKKGDKATVQADFAKNQGGIDWWRVNFGEVVGWCAEDYMEVNDGVVEPPPVDPPVGEKTNLLDYINGTGYLTGYGILYEVRNALGSQERFQSQLVSGGFLQTKNSLAERFIVKDGYIYRDWDTSPGNNRFYRLLENGVPGSRWVPQYMAVGETYTRSRRVQFYNWDCSESSLNSGDVTDTIKFVAKYNSYTFQTGITLNDVIKLEWVNGGEFYYYSRGYGLVAWERVHNDPNTPQWSAISEIHAPGQRPDNVVNLPPCF